MRAAERRTSGPYLRKPRAICLYLSRKHDHAVQMDTWESAVEIIPACAHRTAAESDFEEWKGELSLIPILGAAHEGGKFGVEARRSLEERRVADALVDRKLGA